MTSPLAAARIVIGCIAACGLIIGIALFKLLEG